ncbi:hypothetical protein WBK31_04820 [Nonomuraea sp. N2-4H]|uniref:hypothetical protein n=1 Tax=Nonomuraea sp. N2-4H TaxID=3128898 RepID=UPI0032564606
MVDYLSINRADWNARVPLHVSSDFYDVEGFKKGRNALRTTSSTPASALSSGCPTSPAGPRPSPGS